jgi:capsular exopolysaccharide synthesis family protein
MEEDAPLLEAPVPAPQSRTAFAARFYIQFDHYKRLLWKYGWIPVLAVTAGAGLQWYFIKDAQPQYASVGRMIVGVRIPLPNMTPPIEEVNNFLGTQSELMKSDSIGNRVKQSLQSKRPELHPVPVELEVAISPKASIFNLQAKGAEPAYTQAFLETTMQEYINLKKELFEKATLSTQTSLEAKLKEAGVELEQSHAAVISYRATNDIVIQPAGGNSALDHLSSAQLKLAEAKSDLVSLKITNSENRDEAYKVADSKLVEMKFERDHLTNSTMTSDKLEFTNLNKRIAIQEDMVNYLQTRSEEGMKNAQLVQEQKIQSLIGEVEQWGKKALEENEKMSSLDALKEVERRLQSHYDSIQSDLHTLDMDKGLEQETITTLDAATPAVAIPPQKIKRTIMAGLVGFFLGIGIVVFLDRLDDRPNCFTELEELFAMPVLGQFPLLKPKSRKIGVPILQLDDDRYPLIEANRSLRSALLYQDSRHEQPKSIVISSARPNDGKSMVAANLAVTLAQTGARVLLTDADVRRGVLHKHFSVPSSPGLAEVLLGQCPWSSAVVQTPIPNLFLLPRGTSPRHSVNLFATAGKVLSEIAGHFDYYIFDTSPVMVGDDVLSLAPHVDGVVMVVRAGFTSGRVVQTALDSLQLRRVKVLGLVFNGVRPGASDYYYYKFKEYYPDPQAAKNNGH